MGEVVFLSASIGLSQSAEASGLPQPSHVIIAVVSVGIIVGGSTLCLLCSHGGAVGLMGWAGWLQGDLYNGRVHGLGVMASHLVAEPLGAQQWQ